MDTIFALATAQGKAGVSIIRISGQAAHDLVKLFAEPLPKARVATLRNLKHEHEIIDQAFVIRFDKPFSYTGENMIELQCHGSIAVIAKLFKLLTEKYGFRLAEPGEFTRRALENGRLDLMQIEGLADLIDAETEIQRRQAQRSLSGVLGKYVEDWRTKLIRSIALIEATLDFSDEEVPVNVTPEVDKLICCVVKDISCHLSNAKVSERIRNGFEVAIIGPPNVGKSTLVNFLAGRDAVITSEFAGTTRDVIEVKMDLNGLPVTILDTAGLRESNEVIENIGIERAKERADLADLRIFLSDTMNPSVPLKSSDIWVKPKADQRQKKADAISGITGEGISELLNQITKILSTRTQSTGLITRERHFNAIKIAFDVLTKSLVSLSEGPEQYEFVAEDLRLAIRSLESLIGRIDTEDFLNDIFSSFCLGK
ncbi:MAG: tRNA uridine-5-carboxymethylaminomethyl(34) synthesis GTPase MnmE [Aestuariivita sp.]|nr:tRNA uridine-5-carboxymethylaminomethyl(34) synthesis GTPase MnmE [Aestuariivita sp.]